MLLGVGSGGLVVWTVAALRGDECCYSLSMLLLGRSGSNFKVFTEVDAIVVVKFQEQN